MTPLHAITETIRFLLTMLRHSGIYFYTAVLHTLTLTSQYARLNLDSSEKTKQDHFWYCPVKGSGTPSSSSMPVCETNVRLLYSNTAVDCLTMDPSLDSSFGNWTSKVCNIILCDFGQWATSDVLYKPSKVTLITDCGRLRTTTTWQSLPSTSFPLLFSNPPYNRNRTTEQ